MEDHPQNAVREGADLENRQQVCGYALVRFYDISILMDGFGLSKWLREQRPELEMIWAATLPRTVHAAKELCDDGPQPYPHEPEVVLERIRHLLATRKTNKRKS